MNDLKEKLLEYWAQLSSRVIESDAYIQLSERYRNMSPTVQKALMATGVFLILFIIYSIPAAFIDASATYEEGFQYNRGLIRGLYRSARNPPINANRFTGPSFDQMKTMVDATLSRAQILESQKGDFSPTNKPLPANQVPGAIRQDGMIFEVRRLNLTQVVTLSQSISSLHPNTKLAGVEVLADLEDPHYFNVKFTLSSLSLPIKQEAAKPPPKKR